MHAPAVWPFVLLALATFRVWRILARDSITEKAREAVTGFTDEQAPALNEKVYEPPPGPRSLPEPLVEIPAGVHVQVGGETISESRLIATNDWTIWAYGKPRWRVYLSALIRCPWCSGWWLSLAAAGCYWAEPRWTLVAATPLALSAVLGLTKKNLDA